MFYPKIYNKIMEIDKRNTLNKNQVLIKYLI